MRKQSVLHFCSLLAVAVTVSIAAAADRAGKTHRDSSVLRPVAERSTLKRVPATVDREQQIRQVQYQQNSGQPSQSYNGQQNPGQSGGFLPRLSFGGSQGQPNQQRQQQSNSREQKKLQRKQNPGFLRRFFNSFVDRGDDYEQGTGQAGPSDMPRPPELNYGQNGGQQNDPQRGSVPALPAGYQQQKMTTPPAVPGVDAYPQNVQRPQPHPIRRNNGFVNPFQDQAPQQNDVLLDLDSLIEGQDTVAEARTPVDSEANAATASQEPKRKPVNGPFTGYRLEGDEAVQSNSDDSDPEQEGADQSVRAPEVQKPVVKPEKIEVESFEAPEEFVSEANDLKEPEMQLPPVKTQEETSEPLILNTDPGTNPFESSEATVTEEVPLLEKPVPAESQAADRQPNEFLDSGSRLPSANDAEPSVDSGQSLKVLDTRAKRDQQRYRIMSRTGRAGFKGFCPVALRDERELIDSREEFEAKFGLQTYQFSSPEAKAAFEANPSRYAPAAGGSDVVLLVNTAEEVAGALDFSLWYRDRLYMFRSRETQRLFSADPARYADQY